MKKDVAAYIQGTLKELEYLKLSGVNFEQLEEIGYKNILRLARYFSDCFDPNDLHSEIKSAEKQLKKIGNDNVLKMSELGSKIANLRMILGNLKLGQSNLRQLYEREKNNPRNVFPLLPTVRDANDFPEGADVMVYVGEQILKSAASIAHDQLILPNLQYKWLCGIAIKKCDDSKATHILCDRKIFTARTEGRTTEWGGEHLIQLHVAHPFVLPRKDFYMIRSLINMNKGILKADTLPLLDVESYLDVFFKNCLEVYFAYANEVHLQRDNTEKILLDPSVQEWTDEDLIHKGKAVLDTFADLCPKFGPFEMVRNAAKARGVVLKYDAENATVK